MHLSKKKKRVLALSICVLSSMSVVTSVYAMETQNGWHGDENGKYYLKNNEEVTGINEIDGETYYFDKTGLMQTGWVKTNDEIYYFNKDGSAETGVKKIDGEEYSFQEDGTLQQGWNDSHDMFYDNKGFVVKNAWQEDEGNKYYLGKDGKVVTGWETIDEVKYYFQNNGVMSTGFQDIDGKTYEFNEDGTVKTGWSEKDGNKVYLDKDGVVKDTNIEVDGNTYFFDENGYLMINTDVPGYTIGEDGVAIESKAHKIAEAAKAQLGVEQDCTMLVTNSLKAAGIYFHSAPPGYLSLGEVTDNPVPGDIIVYEGHVAVYIGNGRAVHGGWMGHTTVISSVSCGNKFIAYVHIAG